MSDSGDDGRKLTGERVPAPRGLLTTLLVVLSGLAIVEGAARVFARVALGYRRPASVSLDARGLVVAERTQLLGRTLVEKQTVVPAANLAQIERETRYARLGLYVGLVALALGTYVGVGLVSDGIRAPGGSPSLLGLGALFIVLGVVLDYGLSMLDDLRGGTCRLVIRRRTGGALCIGGLEPETVDALLRELQGNLEPLGPTPSAGAKVTAASELPSG